MERDIYEKAKEKVKKKKRFNQDLSAFLICGSALFLINIFIARGYMWSLWVIFFWGLAVLSKAIDVYGVPFGGKDWEEQEIQREMERLKRLGEGNTESDFPELDRDPEPIEDQKEEPGSHSGRGWNEKDLV